MLEDEKEVSEEAEEVTAEEENAAAEAAFEAGFRGDSEPTEEVIEEKEELEESEDDSKDEEPEEESEEVAPATVLAGLTEDEVKSLLSKAAKFDDLAGKTDKAFGKIGELNRTVNELQSKGSGKVSIGKLKRLEEEYPEIAEMLMEDLNESFVKESSSGPSTEQLTSMINDSIAQSSETLKHYYEERLLTRDHKDWKQVIASDDWGLYLSRLKPEDRQAIDESYDAVFLSEKLDEFKEWNTEPADEKRASKKKRLLRSAQPTGGAKKPQKTQLTDEQAFEAGFKSVRR